MKMTVEIDFDFDSDTTDMVEIIDALKTVFESGAESTNTYLKLLKVISPKPEPPVE